MFGIDSPRFMADSNEPKKETVRIAVPPPSKPPGAGNESHDAVRINLPAHPPSTVPTRPAGPADSAKVVKPPQFFPPSPPPSSPKTPPPPHPTAGSAAARTPGPHEQTPPAAVPPHLPPTAPP